MFCSSEGQRAAAPRDGRQPRETAAAPRQPDRAQRLDQRLDLMPRPASSAAGERPPLRSEGVPLVRGRILPELVEGRLERGMFGVRVLMQ